MKATPPPSASAFLQKHTHHADNDGEEAASSVSVGATDIVSNLIEGIVGGTATGDGNVSERSGSTSPMKHRNESFRSYDQRLPKTYNNDGGDKSSSIPYRGFGSRAPISNSAPETSVRSAPFANLKNLLRGLFSPKEQLLIKLQTQFQKLDVDLEKYALEQDGSMWDEGKHNSIAGKNSRKDPKHPLNNPKLMTGVHFVGRKAIDSSIIELSTLLINHDKFGSITELWLNDNLISDDGAAAISSFLQLPSCALVELWLGNNQIGPTGTTLISGALSNNGNSQLKCLGLYLNPIGNGGASTLAQMLRKNHALSTLDVHGCGSRGKGHYVLEGYGCKVVKVSDGTEYVARVVASIADEKEGIVTDQRFLDAIQTFVAFNRINPTREQTIRGIMSSNKHIKDETTGKEGDNTNERQHQTEVSKFLSGLCNQPANEKLTDDEKRTWKNCEWKRLHVELERARAAKSALASSLEDGVGVNEGNMGEEFSIDGEEGNMDRLVERDGTMKEGEMIGRDLDDEVVQTDARSWRDLKMGITGSSRASPKQRKSPSTGQRLHVISDVENEVDSPGGPPQSVFNEGLASSEMPADSGEPE